MKGSRKYSRRRGASGPVFNLGLSVPRWLGRSWRDILEGLRVRLKATGLSRSLAKRMASHAALRRILKEGSAAQQGQVANEHAKSSAAPPRPKGQYAKPSGSQITGPGQSSRVPSLMDIDEIRRRLTNDGSLPDRVGWTRTDLDDTRVHGYRLVRGPGGDLSIITNATSGAGDPQVDYSATEEEIPEPAGPPPPPLSPPAAPSREQLSTAASGPAAAAPPPPAEVLPGEMEILEVDIAEVEIEEVDTEEVEDVPPVPAGAPRVISPPVQRREPAGATGVPLARLSARPRMPMTYPPQPPETTPLAPAAPDDDAGRPEGVGAPEAPAGQDDECGQSNSCQPRYYSGECLPPLDLLQPADAQSASMSPEELIDCGILIEEKLAEFRVKVNVQDAYAGPVITRYEVQPAVGVRGGQVVNLMRDLARALGVASIRVVETIPGKTCMGLELPNPKRQMIRLSEVLCSEEFQAHKSKLAMVLGKDILGEPVVADLARAPHMLVAGTTGSGKSVGVNAMILSLLYRATPDEVRLVMIDPKMLELSIYDGIPHLLAPVVTDMKHAANALKWCVGEMERRYRLMSALRVRNLAGYNQKVREAVDAGGLSAEPFSLVPGTWEPLAPLPYIVVVVDEFADLMMVAGKKIEELIARLAQKARAAGIHLILATQRPSVDVITGLIKANIPTRIAFQVSSKIDSRTILDQMGAECLLGQGDMLYLPPGTGYPQRVHGAFVADEEVQAVAEYLKQFGEPDYVEGVLGGAEDADGELTGAERTDDENDPLYDEAVEFVISSRRASISAIQRQLRVGYNRAARMVEKMEAAGLVSPMESNGNRTILMPEP